MGTSQQDTATPAADQRYLGEPTPRRDAAARPATIPGPVVGRYREAREYIELTREQAAAKVPCPPRLIEALETDGADPGPEILKRLSILYHRPSAWFMGEFTPTISPGLLHQVEHLGEGDREQVIGFAEFLACMKEAENENA